ncbi:MAG: DUF192 domain-containing protein, partial [Myxococcota bacterium]|nr:DUF192 domain-containing protein [Myxococcota bacterium]
TPGAAAPSVGPASSPTGASRGDSPAAGGRCIQPLPAAPPNDPPPRPAPTCPSDPEAPVARLPIVRVSVPEAREAAVDAELVRSEHDASRGLMYRKHMAEDRGMLFDLHVREDHKFWMHNTCIPLDLIYVDEDGLIVGIVENAPTLDDGSRGVDCPSLFVLEVNAGWSRRHGVRPGQRMAIPAEARER